MSWDRQFLMEVLPDHAERRRLYELAAEYHERTEAFDRSICTGPTVDGSILPATGRQCRRSIRHALQVRDELLVHVTALGFSRGDFIKALQRVGDELYRAARRTGDGDKTG